MKSHIDAIELRPGYIIGEFVNGELKEIMKVKTTLRRSLFGSSDQAEVHLNCELKENGIPGALSLIVPQEQYRGVSDSNGVITISATELRKLSGEVLLVEMKRINPQHPRVRGIRWSYNG